MPNFRNARFYFVPGIALQVVLLALPLVQQANAENRYTLKITNNSTYDIYNIYMSASSRSNWGNDFLGRNQVLKTNYVSTISDILAGEYDIKFVDSDGDGCTLKDIQIFKDLNWSITTDWLLKCEGFHQTSATTMRYSLKVTNNSKLDIRQIYISPTSRTQWGADLLGTQVLSSGTWMTIAKLIPGNYDVKFVDEDGDECILNNTRVAQDTSWSLTSDWLLSCEGFKRHR